MWELKVSTTDDARLVVKLINNDNSTEAILDNNPDNICNIDNGEIKASIKLTPENKLEFTKLENITNLSIDAVNCEINCKASLTGNIDIKTQQTLLINENIQAKNLNLQAGNTYINDTATISCSEYLNIISDTVTNNGNLKGKKSCTIKTSNLTNHGSISSNQVVNLYTNKFDNLLGVVYSACNLVVDITESNWVNEGDLVAEYGDLLLRGPLKIDNHGNVQGYNINIQGLTEFNNYNSLSATLDILLESFVTNNYANITTTAGRFCPVGNSFSNINLNNSDKPSMLAVFDLVLNKIAKMQNQAVVCVSNSVTIGDSLTYLENALGATWLNYGDIKHEDTAKNSNKNSTLELNNLGDWRNLGNVLLKLKRFINSGSFIDEACSNILATEILNTGLLELHDLKLAGVKFINDGIARIMGKLISTIDNFINNNAMQATKLFSHSGREFINGQDAELLTKNFELKPGCRAVNQGNIAAASVSVELQKKLDIRQDSNLLALQFEKPAKISENTIKEIEKTDDIATLKNYFNAIKTNVRAIKQASVNYQAEMVTLTRKNNSLRGKINSQKSEIFELLEQLEQGDTKLRRELDSLVNIDNRKRKFKQQDVPSLKARLIQSLKAEQSKIISGLKPVKPVAKHVKTEILPSAEQDLSARRKALRSHLSRYYDAKVAAAPKTKVITAQTLQADIKYFLTLFDKNVQEYLTENKIYNKKLAEYNANLVISRGLDKLFQALTVNKPAAFASKAFADSLKAVKLKQTENLIDKNPIPMAAAKPKPSPTTVNEELRTSPALEKRREYADEFTISHPNQTSANIAALRTQAMRAKRQSNELQAVLKLAREYKLKLTDKIVQRVVDVVTMRNISQTASLGLATFIKKLSSTNYNLNRELLAKLSCELNTFNAGLKEKLKPGTSVIQADNAVVSGAIVATNNNINSNKLNTSQNSLISGNQKTNLEVTQSMRHQGLAIGREITATGDAKLLHRGTFAGFNTSVEFARVNLDRGSEVLGNATQITSHGSPLQASGLVYGRAQYELNSTEVIEQNGLALGEGKASLNAKKITHSKNSVTKAEQLLQQGEKLQQNGTNIAKNITDNFQEITYSGTDAGDNVERNAAKITRKRGGKTVAKTCTNAATQLTSVASDHGTYETKVVVRTPRVSLSDLRQYARHDGVELFLEEKPDFKDRKLEFAGSFTMHLPPGDLAPVEFKSLKANKSVFLDIPGRDTYYGTQDSPGQLRVGGNYTTNSPTIYMLNARGFVLGDMNALDINLGRLSRRQKTTLVKQLEPNRSRNIRFNYTYHESNNNALVTTGKLEAENLTAQGATLIAGDEVKLNNYSATASTLTATGNIECRGDAELKMTAPARYTAKEVQCLKDRNCEYPYQYKAVFQTSKSSSMVSNDNASVAKKLTVKGSTLAAHNNISSGTRRTTSYTFGTFEQIHKCERKKIDERKGGFFGRKKRWKPSERSKSDGVYHARATVSSSIAKVEVKGDSYDTGAVILAKEVNHKKFKVADYTDLTAQEITALKKTVTPTSINLSEYARNIKVYEEMAAHFEQGLNNLPEPVFVTKDGKKTLKLQAFSEVQMLRRALLDITGKMAMTASGRTEDTYRLLRQNALDDMVAQQQNLPTSNKPKPKIVYDKNGDAILELPKAYQLQVAKGKSAIFAEKVNFTSQTEGSKVEFQGKMQTDKLKAAVDKFRTTGDVTATDSALKVKQELEIAGCYSGENMEIEGVDLAMQVTGELTLSNQFKVRAKSLEIAQQLQKELAQARIRKGEMGTREIDAANGSSGQITAGTADILVTIYKQHGGSFRTTRGNLLLNAKTIQMQALEATEVINSNRENKLKSKFHGAKLESTKDMRITCDTMVGAGIELTARGHIDISFTEALMLQEVAKYYELPVSKKKGLIHTRVSGGMMPVVLNSVINGLEGVTFNSESGRTMLQNVEFTSGEPALNIDEELLERLQKEYNPELWSYKTVNPVVQIAAAAISAWACPALSAQLLAGYGSVAVSIGTAVLQATSQTLLTGGDFGKNLLSSLATVGMAECAKSIAGGIKSAKLVQDVAEVAIKSAGGAIVDHKLYGGKFSNTFARSFATSMAMSKLAPEGKAGLGRQMVMSGVTDAVVQRVSHGRIDGLQSIQAAATTAGGYLGNEASQRIMLEQNNRKIMEQAYVIFTAEEMEDFNILDNTQSKLEYCMMRLQASNAGFGTIDGYYLDLKRAQDVELGGFVPAAAAKVAAKAEAPEVDLSDVPVLASDKQASESTSSSNIFEKFTTDYDVKLQSMIMESKLVTELMGNPEFSDSVKSMSDAVANSLNQKGLSVDKLTIREHCINSLISTLDSTSEISGKFNAIDVNQNIKSEDSSETAKSIILFNNIVSNYLEHVSVTNKEDKVKKEFSAIEYAKNRNKEALEQGRELPESAQAQLVGTALVQAGIRVVDGIASTYGAISRAINDVDDLVDIDPEVSSAASERMKERSESIRKIKDDPILLVRGIKDEISHNIEAAEKSLAEGDMVRAGQAIGNVLADTGGVLVTGYGAISAARKASALAVKSTRRAAESASKFVGEHEFRSPLTFEYKPGQLNSGIPVDQVGVQNPVVKKTGNKGVAAGASASKTGAQEYIAGKNRIFDLFREHGATSGSLNKLLEPCDPKVVKAMRDKGYTVHVAKKGTDEYRYLVNNNIEASFNNAVGLEKHILVIEGATKSAVLEEFLHSVQNRIPSLKNKSPLELEVHVKEFMIRHAKILGLESEADLALLRQLRIEEITRLNEPFGRKP